MVLIEEVNEPEIKPVKVEEKKPPVEKTVENAKECFWKITSKILQWNSCIKYIKKPPKKIAAQPKSRPQRKAKFVIELDNKDPDEGKIVEKTDVERKLDDELDDEERAKNYPRWKKIFERVFFVFMKGWFYENDLFYWWINMVFVSRLKNKMNDTWNKLE